MLGVLLKLINCLFRFYYIIICIKITVYLPSRSLSNLMSNVDNFTIFIKNDIQFKKFDIKTRNILPNITSQYITYCKHNITTDPFCPIIQLKEILEKAEPNRAERLEMLKKVF